MSLLVIGKSKQRWYLQVFKVLLFYMLREGCWIDLQGLVKGKTERSRGGILSSLFSRFPPTLEKWVESIMENQVKIKCKQMRILQIILWWSTLVKWLEIAYITVLLTAIYVKFFFRVEVSFKCSQKIGNMYRENIFSKVREKYKNGKSLRFCVIEKSRCHKAMDGKSREQGCHGTGRTGNWISFLPD